MGLEMLCCAQHDSAVLLPLLTPLTLIAFDGLFLRLMCIIADLSAPQAGAMNWAQRPTNCATRCERVAKRRRNVPPYKGRKQISLNKEDTSAIEGRVRFARRRFGHYEVVDFVAVLLGYAISRECTLEAFYERLQPFANAFLALFGRNRLPARSTLSRFLVALVQAPVEALRMVFLEDLVARSLEKEEKAGGLWDRQGTHYRLSWVQRLARNAHALTAGQVTIKLFGVPPAFAAFLGLPAV